MQVTKKSEWVESEFTKWKERFEIPFVDEFNVKVMLGLRYDYENTPNDHYKAKGDILHALCEIRHALDGVLIEKKPNAKRKIMVIVDNDSEVLEYAQMLMKNLDNVDSKKIYRDKAEIGTNEFRFVIIKNNASLRGHRCQALFDLSSGKNANESVSLISVEKLKRG